VLAKLAVGKDAGTSRPATAAAHSNKPAPGQQQVQQELEQLKHKQSHTVLQPLGSQTPDSDIWTHGAVSRTSAGVLSRKQAHSLTADVKQHSITALLQSNQAARTQAAQQPWQEGLSSTLAELLAATDASRPPGARKTVPAQTCSPVAPHATKPYRAIPPVSILRHRAAAARQSCSRPATAASHCSRPVAAASLCSRPMTAALIRGDGTQTACRAYSSAVQHSGMQISHGSARPHSAADIMCRSPATSAALLRPGSAAAAKILRAMDKACAAPSSTAGAHCPDKPALLQSSSSERRHDMLSQMQLRQQMALSEANPAAGQAGVKATTATTTAPGAAPVTTSGCVELQRVSNQDTDAGTSSRPATAVLQAVLAAAAADDGVDDRLAAIRQHNSRSDQSAGLDIVFETDERLSEDRPTSCFSQLGGGAAAHSTLGQQAAPMVLNLEDFTQSTPEVLELELESLDLGQLTLLQKLLSGV